MDYNFCERNNAVPKMASAIVASTSATTPPSSAVATVARSDEGDLDRENPIGSAPSGGGDKKAVSVEGDTMDSRREAASLMEEKKSSISSSNNNPSQHGNKIQERIQSSLPLSEKIRSSKAIQVGNEFNTKRLSVPSSLATNANNDPSIPGRTVATTSEKGFGEGPLPRELRRIIMEVAKTGKCSWLSWNHETMASKRNGAQQAAAGDSGFDSSISGKDSKAGLVSKSSIKMASSSPPSQYSPLLANKSGGVVRKQSSLGATRRSAVLPPRKRHRNGIVHKGGERMRFGSPDGAFGRSNASSNSRKRPLVLIRTNSGTAGSTASANSSSNITTNNINISSTSPKLGSNILNASASSGMGFGGIYSSAPSSVGSGRSTGSEPDYDSAPYECDSEGTSATTNSEISVRKTTRAKRSGTANTQGAQINSGVDTWTDTATMYDGEDETNSVDGNNAIPGSPYKTLQTAFRGALGLVLDHFYQSRDNGYKLSPAEKRRNERFAETLNRNNSSINNHDLTMKSEKLSSLLSSEYVFQQRRQRLMATLLPSNEHESGEPPFTIQRIAEVLVAPDRVSNTSNVIFLISKKKRGIFEKVQKPKGANFFLFFQYYSQTHKLCNCLEKLLLVNASTDSYGGSTGGDTSQRRREERELAALTDEKGRQEFKLRQRKIAKSKTPIHEFVTDDHLDTFAMSRSGSNNEITPDESVAINPAFKSRTEHLAGRSEKETMGTNSQSIYLSQKRSLSASSDSSTPREMLEALTRASLRNRFDHVGTDSQQQSANERDVCVITENRRITNSPPLPGLSMESGIASAHNMPIAGRGDTNYFVRQHHSEQQQQQQNEDHGIGTRVTSPILFSSGNESNLEASANNINILQYHHAVALAGISLNRSSDPSPLDNLMTFDASTISQMRSQTNATGTGPGSESTDGRSSASNSDIDSESDDISFDDSASDRSDGSDSGSTSAHHEPFTAARAMLLNRIHQHQRLQSRQQGESFRPPTDSEYQSGDSIDSTRAEDSGGSDSSSSDVAD